MIRSIKTPANHKGTCMGKRKKEVSCNKQPCPNTNSGNRRQRTRSKPGNNFTVGPYEYDNSYLILLLVVLLLLWVFRKDVKRIYNDMIKLF